MKKNGWILILFFALLCGQCANEPSGETNDTTPAETTPPVEMTGQELLDNLRENALEEGDVLGRLQASLKVLQEVYTRSEASMPDLKEVRLEVNEQCRLTVYNQAQGARKTVIDLSQLDLNAMGLIADNAPGEFPGMRIGVQGGKPLVEEYEGEQLITSNNEWVIFLADRPSIEKIAPVVVQMVRLCQGHLE